MAIPSNIQITTNPGSGNADGFENSLQAITRHTGRGNKVTEIVGTYLGEDDTIVTINLTEIANPEFVRVTGSDVSISVGNAGGVRTITGFSNSPSLTLSFDGNETGATLPTTMTVNGSTYTPGTAIANDPGGSPNGGSQYPFSIQITIPANGTVEPRTTKLVIRGSIAGATDNISIFQEAGEPYLWVGAIDQTSIDLTISQAGTAVPFTVFSNTTWEFK